MRLLLLNIIDDEREVEKLFDNLGLAYISACLKKNIKDIQINFAHIANIQQFEKKIELYRPDIIGISTVSQNFGTAINIARHCKDKDIPIIIGGTHISMLPQSLDKSMDIGILGEAEITIVELLKTFQKNNGFKQNKLEKIKGLVFYKRGKLIFTPHRKLIENIDSIPFPDRSILNINLNKVMLISSRGCPYNCIFCASKRFWKKARFHSPMYVISEIEEVHKKYKPKEILFFDDLFIANTNRLRQIVDLIVKRGIHKKIYFTVQCRANLVNDELCRLLKRMNVKVVMMGIETGSQPVLRYLKDNVTIKENEDSIRLLKKYGFNVACFFIIGTPLDTEKRLEETLTFIKRNQLDIFEVYFLTPHPGTPIWNYAEKKGLVSHDMQWEKLKFGFSRIKKLDDINRALVLSGLDKKLLFNYYNKMLSQKKLRKLFFIIRSGFKYPYLIMPYITKKIKLIGKNLV